MRLVLVLAMALVAGSGVDKPYRVPHNVVEHLSFIRVLHDQVDHLLRVKDLEELQRWWE